MSGVGFYITTPEVALVAATAKTAVQIIAAANHRVKVDRFSFFFDGQSVGDEPVLVEWNLLGGSAPTGTAGAPVKVDPDDSETLQVDFVYNMTVEPGISTVFARWLIHPQGGYELVLPIHRPMIINGGDDYGLRFTAQNAVNVVVNVEGEE